MTGYMSFVVFIALIAGGLPNFAAGADSLDKATGSLRRGGGQIRGTREEHQDNRLHRHRLTLGTQTVKQKLMICNAYTSKKGLDVIQVRTMESLTGSSPLTYKQCREYELPLQEGDQFDFKAGELDVGTFYATGLPKTSASLLLVPHRREPRSASVSFESHAFADVRSPQIAVVDAYKGQGARAVKIVEKSQVVNDTPGSDKASQEQLEEDLNFNSVVAVNPGKYQVALIGTGSTAAMPLSAKDQAKYVVIRVGNSLGEKSSKEFAEELIVFPNSAFAIARLSLMCILVVAMCVV